MLPQPSMLPLIQRFSSSQRQPSRSVIPISPTPLSTPSLPTQQTSPLTLARLAPPLENSQINQAHTPQFMWQHLLP